MLNRKKNRMVRITTLVSAALPLAAALLLVMIPSTAVAAQTEPGSAPPVEVSLEQLSNMVQRLEAELACSRNPLAERLEEQLEGVIEGLEALLDLLDHPLDEEDIPTPRPRIVQFDLTMHRLLYLLEEILEQPNGTQHADVRETFEGLRRWIDGYITAMTVGMPPQEARRFEAAAERAMRDLVRHLTDMARRSQIQAENQATPQPALARLVERLETLIFRLDGCILEHFPDSIRPELQPQGM